MWWMLDIKLRLVRFSLASSPTKRILNTYNEVSSTNYGRIQYNRVSNGILVEFTVMLNVGNKNLTGNSTVAKSTGVHELAHAIGLDDLTSGTTIMNGNRDRTRIHTLQSIDKTRINTYYSAQQSRVNID